MNLWPPLLFNGIRVLAIAGDWSRARVVLKLRPWNRNRGLLTPCHVTAPAALCSQGKEE